jgi:hypothetical protein
MGLGTEDQEAGIGTSIFMSWASFWVVTANVGIVQEEIAIRVTVLRVDCTGSIERTVILSESWASEGLSVEPLGINSTMPRSKLGLSISALPRGSESAAIVN